MLDHHHFMSTEGNPEDNVDADKASYNPDARQANAVLTGVSANKNAAEVDHTFYNPPPPSQEAQRNRGTRRFFGIPKGIVPAYPNPDDYENKYPEDAYGEETCPTARVWRTYLDEARKADGELIEGWRDTTDVLLVFAGLFSAVVATFVVQTSTALQPDYTQVTASLLLETNSLLRAFVNQTLSDSIPSSLLDPASSFSSSANDKWVNGLWFTSLSVSLVTAFIAMLVKQWIQHYQSVVFGTPREQVRIRQFRFLGVEHWQMPLIIGILPMLLHLALLLYFIGLIVFLIPLDGQIAYTTATIAALAYGFYFLSTLLPLWYPMCPYKTPLSSVLAWLVSSLRMLIPFLMARFHQALLRIRPSNGQLSHQTPTQALSKGHSGALHRLREAEKKAAEDTADEIEAHALVWLHSTSSNPTVTNITIQAISGLRLDFEASAKNILKAAVTFKGNTVERELVERFFALNRHPYDTLENGVLAKMERLLRACHQLGVVLPFTVASIARGVFWKVDEPRSIILNACLSMLYDDAYIREGEDPIASLESYDYANEGPQPVMWIALLKRSLRHSFRTPSECWSHAFKVLAAFYSKEFSYSGLRLCMILEYICSLSFLDPNGGYQRAVPDGEWGGQSVLNDAPICYAKVARKIYSALSMAINALRDRVTPMQEDFLDVLSFILYRLAHDTIEAKAEEKEQIAAGASGLRIIMQTLVESDVWKDDAQGSRNRCCHLIFDSSFWPSSALAYRISWTQELMDCFLRSGIGRDRTLHYANRKHHFHSYFSDGMPQIYQLFLEQDGLSDIVRERHGDEFLQHYLDGLLCWKGSTADLNRQLDHLFQPNNFRRVMREFVFTHDSDGNLNLYEPAQVQIYDPIDEDRVDCGPPWHMETTFPGLVTRLFKLRSPDLHPDSYGHYLGPLRELQLKDPDDEGPSFQELLVMEPQHSTVAPPCKWLDDGRDWVRNVMRRGHKERVCEV